MITFIFLDEVGGLGGGGGREDLQRWKADIMWLRRHMPLDSILPQPYVGTVGARVQISLQRSRRCTGKLIQPWMYLPDHWTVLTSPLLPPTPIFIGWAERPTNTKGVERPSTFSCCRRDAGTRRSDRLVFLVREQDSQQHRSISGTYLDKDYFCRHLFRIAHISKDKIGPFAL